MILSRGRGEQDHQAGAGQMRLLCPEKEKVHLPLNIVLISPLFIVIIETIIRQHHSHNCHRHPIHSNHQHTGSHDSHCGHHASR